MSDSDKNKQLESKEDLKGFDIHIDPFGNVSSNMKVEDINKFLDSAVDDKKLSSNTEEE